MFDIQRTFTSLNSPVASFTLDILNLLTKEDQVFNAKLLLKVAIYWKLCFYEQSPVTADMTIQGTFRLRVIACHLTAQCNHI